MNKIFLFDTNILYELMSLFSEKPSPIAVKIQFLFQKITHEKSTQLFIPDIVWSEFTISLFQKQIPYEEYDLWHNRILNSYLQVYRLLYENNVDSYKTCEYSQKLNIDFLGLANDLSLVKMSPNYIQEKIKRKKIEIENAEQRLQKNPDDSAIKEYINRNKKNLKSGKQLDGLDALIVSSVIIFSMANPEKNVTFVSNDNWMAQAALHLIKNAKMYGLRDLQQKPFSLHIVNPKAI